MNVISLLCHFLSFLVLDDVAVSLSDSGSVMYNFTTRHINQTFPDFESSQNKSQYFKSPLHLTLFTFEQQRETSLENAFSYGPDPTVEVIEPLKTISRYVFTSVAVQKR